MVDIGEFVEKKKQGLTVHEIFGRDQFTRVAASMPDLFLPVEGPPKQLMWHHPISSIE